MLRVCGLRLLALLIGGLWLPVGISAQSTRFATLSGAIDDDDTAPSANSPLLVQDKADQPAQKPSAPTKPPAPPKAPPSPTARPPIPPRPTPATPQPQFNPFANAQPNQSQLARLSRTPDMFGDSFGSITAKIQFIDVANRTGTSLVDLPVAGGSRQFKNEYSRAMPTDRVFGLYHHFQNALESSSSNGSFRTANANIDRFTFGFEKTFFEGNASVEMRMPFSSPVSLSSPGSNFQMQSVGDLVVSLKGMLYSDESQAFAVGLAVDAPTGSDLNVNLPNSGPASFTLHNNATHLIPFIAYQAAPTEDFFFNGFLQFDTPTNANTVQVQRTGAPVENLSVTNQTLMFVDTSFGYWWYRDPDSARLSGLASVFELHYTTAVNNADIVADKAQRVTFGSNAGHFDVLNLTLGLQANIARSAIIRAGYVTPLRSSPHRFFDNELSVAVVFRL